MNGQNLLVGFALGIAALSNVACKQVECGAGTIEVDGVCQAGDEPGTPECGAGFIYDTETGRCEPDYGLDGGNQGICDPTTTVAVVDDAGITHCIGTGTSTCAADLPCPPPSAGQMSICGRVLNVRNTLPLDDDVAEGGPAEGILVSAYEPLSFADNPSATPPIMTVPADTCGRYVMENVQVPATGFIAIAVDDDPGSGEDLYLLTGIAFPAAAGTFSPTVAWVTELALVEAWGAAAGQDFVTEGVYLPIFLNPEVAPYPSDYMEGTPVMGVKVTEGTTVFADRDFYFSDAEPLLRETIAPAQDSTGVNGSALMINTGLVNHGGTGGEGDCSWPNNLGAAIGGVVFVQERHLECN